MIDCYVHGLGFWRPGYPSHAAWLAGEADDTLSKPTAGLLAGPLKRRSSLLTRMAIEVFEQAATTSQTDIAEVKSVWAIAHGESHTAVSLMEMMHTGEGKLSPTKFHNSVYNTASGYASIASHNQAPSTTISGGPEIVGTALLEAIGLLEEHAGDVVVVWADEPPPSPFQLRFSTEPLALALHLSRKAENARARLSGLRREVAPADEDGVEDLYIASALPLFERIAGRRSGAPYIERPRAPGARVWSIDVSFSD